MTQILKIKRSKLKKRYTNPDYNNYELRQVKRFFQSAISITKNCFEQTLFLEVCYILISIRFFSILSLFCMPTEDLLNNQLLIIYER